MSYKYYYATKPIQMHVCCYKKNNNKNIPDTEIRWATRARGFVFESNLYL